jgi:hypothetical protein
MKGLPQLRKEVHEVCKIDGCGKPLTQFIGPGSERLCRDHQLNLREYDGAGRLDRPHTLNKKKFCEDCGYNPWEDTKWANYRYKEEDPELFNRLCRSRLIGDHHGDRRADGGDDSAENIKTLCLFCNADETILNEDYLPSKTKQILAED